MKTIFLTCGMTAMVDDDDFELVSKYKWSAHRGGHSFYAVTNCSRKLHNGKQRMIRMHRLILKAVAGEIVDHKDHNGLNNSRSNIRICTQSENVMNSRFKSNNTSGYRGVFWLKKKKTFRVCIHANKKVFRLGHYKDPIQAALAYNAKAIELHGEFATLNKISTSIMDRNKPKQN